MKIHSLTLQGIGPFVDEHSVDFDAFDEAGLFLLEGPTGSGKSSIIDALVFALYGRVSGGMDNADQRIRSTYCGDDQPSRVTLLFETGSGLYEVTRTPGYQPTGRKTPKPSSVRLDRVTMADDGSVASREGMATKKAEVDQEILDLIGLDAQQFRQTVVLPQGEFSAFLMAGSEDRRRILQDIFGTGLYLEIQTYLQREARQARENVTQAQAKAQGQAESLLQALNRASAAELAEIADLIGGAELTLDDAGRLPDLFARANAAALEAEECLVEEAKRATAKEIASGARVIEAERAAGLKRQRDQLEADLALLLSADGSVEADDRRLQAARRASEPLQRYRAWQAARSTLQQATEEAAEARAALLNLVEGPTGSLLGLDPAGELSSALLTESLAEIARGRGGLQALFSQELARTRLTGEIARADARLGELNKELDASRLEVRRAREDLTRAELILEGRERLEADQETLSVLARADVIRGDLDQARRVAQGMADRAKDAGEGELELRGRWLAASVGAVAAELRDGSPCPVCGSIEHPRPADASDDSVSLDEVNRATAQRQAADELLRAAQADVVQAQTQLEQLGDLPDLDSGKRNQLREDLDRRQAEYQEAQGLRASAQEAIVRAEASTGTIREDIARAESLRTEGMRQLEDVTAAVRAAALPFDTLKEKDAVLGRAAEAIAALVELQRAAQEAGAAEADTRADLESGAESAGYTADREGFRRIVEDSLPDDRIEQLAERIASHRARRAQVEEQLAKLLVDEGTAALAAALPELRDRHAEDRVRHEEGQRALAEWRAEQRALRQRFDAVSAQIERWRRQSEAAGPAVRLAAIANATGAENLLKTPLASYVLMRRLDEVLDATNPRLREFSNHHYELVRQTEGRDGNRKTGLGLEILDNETGRRRPPGTLSGGEVFYTSLALALGLAEIVTAEAGGFDLGTVFIDEGFGSLDSETLDVVMKHLEDLRSGGRTIGVVSHVAEMQSRISDGIRVRRLGPGRGSTFSLRC